MTMWIPFIGRLLMSLIFLVSGFQKLMHFASTQHYIAQHGMPMTAVFAAGAVLIEIAGGLALVFGLRARTAALIMALYLIPVTLVFHGRITDPSVLTQFLKNAGLIGGLLMVYAFDAGGITLENMLNLKRK